MYLLNITEISASIESSIAAKVWEQIYNTTSFFITKKEEKVSQLKQGFL